MAQKGAFLRAAETAEADPHGAFRSAAQRNGGTDGTAQALAFLLSCGLLEQSGGSLRAAEGVPPETLRLFAGFLDRFAPRIAFAPLADCPVHVCTAMPGPLPQGWRREALQRLLAQLACGGQGLERHRAVLGCLGELAERLSLIAQGPEDPLVLERQGEDDGDLPAGAFLQFSAAQEKELAGRVPALAAVWEGERIGWNRLSRRRMRVTSAFSDGTALIPAFAVLLGEGRNAGIPQLPLGSALGSTLGAAVWTDPETAARRAVLELAERDAAGIWWHNRLGITPLPWAQVREFLPKICADWLSARARVTHFLYLPVDFSLHVIAAVSHGEDGKSGVIGVAGGLEAGAVLQSAIGELVQGEFALELAGRSSASGKEGGTVSALQSYAARDVRQDLRLEAATAAVVQDLEREFSWQEFEASLMAQKIRIWLADCSRAETGLACVKAVSPDLCSWLPRFGNPRLFTSPVRWGLRPLPAEEGEFSGRHYPF